jgi:hypothetical protein
MSLQYSCFISYPHGDGEVVKPFMENLRSALRSRLEPYVDLPVFYDKERLEPGYLYNAALAEAVCRSLCMIVVYMPRYESSSYCLRELSAMEELERRRLPLIRPLLPTKLGLVMPIILRKTVRLPSWITAERQYCDFSQYIGGVDFTQFEVIRPLETIAESICLLYDAYINLEEDPCSVCDDFVIPPEEAVLDRLRRPRWNAKPPLVRSA